MYLCPEFCFTFFTHLTCMLPPQSSHASDMLWFLTARTLLKESHIMQFCRRTLCAIIEKPRCIDTVEVCVVKTLWLLRRVSTYYWSNVSLYIYMIVKYKWEQIRSYCILNARVVTKERWVVLHHPMNPSFALVWIFQFFDLLSATTLTSLNRLHL